MMSSRTIVLASVATGGCLAAAGAFAVWYAPYRHIPIGALITDGVFKMMLKSTQFYNTRFGKQKTYAPGTFVPSQELLAFLRMADSTKRKNKIPKSLEQGYFDDAELARLNRGICRAMMAVFGSGMVNRLHYTYVTIPGITQPCIWQAAANVDTSTTAKTLLYFHGGGMGILTAKAYRGHVEELSAASATRVLSVEYDLATSTSSVMTAFDQGLAAYKFLLELGVKPQDIIILGESAGAYMTLNVLFKIQEANLDLPAAGLLLTPMMDPSEKFGFSEVEDLDVTLPKSRMSLFNRLCYMSAHTEPTDPAVSPLFRDTWAGLPPLYITVTSPDPLMPEGVATYKKALASGVHATLDVGSNMFHAYHLYSMLKIPESVQGLGRIAGYIRGIWS